MPIRNACSASAGRPSQTDEDGILNEIFHRIGEGERTFVVVGTEGGNETNTSALPFVAPYDPAFRWDGSNYFGASLAALGRLGDRKGYKLVGCSFSGVNAFFGREDLVGDHFAAPFTAANHFEPPRYFMLRPSGHRPAVGRLEIR